MRYEELSVGELNVNRVLGNGVKPEYEGENFHLVKAKTTADLYYELLRRKGVSKDRIFATLALAEAAMTSDQGDTLYVWPGDHLVTESITWDKDNTRIIGAGGPNQAYQPGTLTNGGVRLTCVTTGISEILNITGHYVQIYDLGTYNSFSAVNNYCDIRIAGKNFYGKRLSLRGGNGANQLATVGAGVPLIVDGTVAGAGNGLLIEDSIIGSSGNSARTKGPGCLELIGSAAGTFGMHFKNCTFSTRIQTATADSVGLVYLSANYAADRELLFDGCIFYNFTENLGTGPTYVFRDSCGTTHQIVLKNCVANKGFTSWTDAATYISSSNPVPHLTGGIGVNS
jgi:hypothetical protein